MSIKWLLSTNGLLTVFMAVAGVLLALSFRTAFNAVFKDKMKKRLPKEASSRQRRRLKQEKRRLNAIKNGVSLVIILGMALTYPACQFWPIALVWLIAGLLALVYLALCVRANNAAFASMFTTIAFVALFGVAVGFLRVAGKTGDFWWSIGVFIAAIGFYLMFAAYASFFNKEARMERLAEEGYDDTDYVDFEFEADNDDDNE